MSPVEWKDKASRNAEVNSTYGMGSFGARIVRRKTRYLRYASAVVLGAFITATSSVLTGCGSELGNGGDSSASGQASGLTKSSGQASADLLTKVLGSHGAIRFSGEREITLHYGPEGIEQTSRYLERVDQDGTGQFSLEVLDVLEPNLPDPDEQLELILLNQAEGMHHRYRDFVIQNPDLFLQNYDVIDSGARPEVAGQACVELLVYRKLDPDCVYTIKVEPVSGIVLALEHTELDSGELVREMEFEWIDFAPDHSNVLWHVPVNDETAIDLQVQGVHSDLGFEPLLPKWVPETFVLNESASVKDPSVVPGDPGSSFSSPIWQKLTYTDGLETLFFLYGGQEPEATAQGSGGSHQLFGAPSHDQMMVVEQRGWTAMQGTVRRHRLLVMGRIDEYELGVMIQSALP